MGKLQFDPVLDVLGEPAANVFITQSKTGESLFTDQIERLARGPDPSGACWMIFPAAASSRSAITGAYWSES